MCSQHPVTGQEKRKKERREFITVNANERVPVYNSVSLPALMAQSRSGESACIQYVYVAAMYADPTCYITLQEVEATVIIR